MLLLVINFSQYTYLLVYGLAENQRRKIYIFYINANENIT